MTLREFLSLPHRFMWGGEGGDDCLMFCASWVAEVTGVDPVAEFRGTYDSAEGAMAIIDRNGGMVALVDAVAKRAGLKRTDNPQTGDIGIIIAPSGLDDRMKEIGAIRYGPNWAALGPSGVVGKKVDFVAAWRLPA